jgi:hypothetical protein
VPLLWKTLKTLPKIYRIIYRTNKFNKISGYKVNVQISVPFLHTNNVLVEQEIKRTKPFIIALKNIKTLGIKLTKKVKGLYTEN